MNSQSKNTAFDAIALSIASPETILSWSRGEITKPETINYRTQKPERDGLFCERIFGPVKNWECACGKYKRIRYRGIVCERCGVEVTHSRVRRERMGHIKLAVPVSHTWFLRSTPSRLGLLLNLSIKQLEQVIYFASYVVVEVDESEREEELGKIKQEYDALLKTAKEEIAAGLKAAKTALNKGEIKEKDLAALEADNTARITELATNYKKADSELKLLEVGAVLTETQHRDLAMKFGHVFRSGIGADALREIIQKIDLKRFVTEMEKEMKVSSGQKQKKIVKRVKLASSFLKNKIRPEWMVLTVIPVIPPELRPMVQLDGGRFATSDLNDLYRRVLNRNSRLKKLIQLGAPEIICRNEKRMLQEAVDILISNSVRNNRSGVSYVQKRKLRSLSDMLKGKQGRFRQNLLGKRVDYSGRSVIVVGPSLRLDECGLPKYIAIELFKPFVIGKLIEYELAHNVKSAEKYIRAGEKVVWDILDEVIKGKYVLLNRAPTLHRLGIQAFKPRLVEGKALHLHPLVCTAFNADFDGDQMAIHLPLGIKAQAEAENLMAANKNLLKPSSGEPIINASQDMVLGCYFLTQSFPGKLGEGLVFSSTKEAIQVYESGLVHLQSPIKVRLEDGEYLETTVGRIIFNSIIPEELGYLNESFGKNQLRDLLQNVFAVCGEPVAAELADRIKDLGFKYATASGVSMSVFDLYTPETKKEIIEKANHIVQHINQQYQQGLLTDEERYTHTIKLWNRIKSEITNEMTNFYKKDQENDVFYQINSGARGNWGHITQLAGMKGLVMSPSGRTIELPIRSNLQEGFSILEYFIATHGGRKGKSDTALKTAEAGYLTRRLVDSVQDTIVREMDCGTSQYKEITRSNSQKIGLDFESRLFGRVLSEAVCVGKKTVLKAGEVIDREQLEIIREHQIESVRIRSVMFCETSGGVCAKCYGYDLAKNHLVAVGTPVGIIAAQSIGEPGTQLTMRTFHMGGVATEEGSITQGLPRVDELFEARSPKFPAVLSEINGTATVKKDRGGTHIEVVADKAEAEVHTIGAEYAPTVKKGDTIKDRQIIAKLTEGRSNAVRARCSGKVTDISPNSITIQQSEAQRKEYQLSNRHQLLIKNGDQLSKGQAISSGHIDLRQLMELTSIERVQEYILYEVQYIYASQGQGINEKHIEIIVKQMASKVRIVDSGDSDWLAGEVHDIIEVNKLNEKLLKKKKAPVVGERLLSGLTRIALWTKSWLSASSFQETIRVLVEASTTRQIDPLDGIKENVIIGRLIPAGEYFPGDK